MLHRQRGIAITYYAFDVLAIDGSKTTAQPYRERRQLLENMHLEGRA